MRTWYLDANDKPAYYQEGSWIFDPDGLPTFYVSRSCWFKDGKAEFYLKDNEVFSASGLASFHAA